MSEDDGEHDLSEFSGADQFENEIDEDDSESRNSLGFDENDNGNEELRRTPSSLNSFPILPPIRSTTTDVDKKQKASIKKLKEKYTTNDDRADKNGTDDKLDDAYLKMKRLDKALEEAFEKERQVKTETMSLMKKLRTEMQSMTVPFNDDSHGNSNTQTNLKRFLALDEEILKYDGEVLNEESSNDYRESVFKTQINDPLGDSSSTTSTDKSSTSTNKRMAAINKTKKSSISSNSTTFSRGTTKKANKASEKDFIKRNIELAKELGGTWALTDDERKRLDEIMKDEDEQTNTVAVQNQFVSGYVPLTNDAQRLKEIDELLEKEYYNPFLNHQLRRNHQVDSDFGHVQQVAEEENDFVENQFGERTLKETRLQREHRQRLKRIEEKLEHIHRPKTDEKVEAILTEDQLRELLGQCTVDQMKQRYSLLNNDSKEIDFSGFYDYALMPYVERDQPTPVNEDIIQSLLLQAAQEGIVKREFHDDSLEDLDELSARQTAATLSLAPVIDRPISSASTSSYIDHKND